ncbi:hypothetical protein [Streptomyces sp. JL4002]
MAPPGFPDFMSRTRVVHPGPVRLHGRAWSGYGPVVRVEFSGDGGRTWTEAAVEPRGPHPWAWQAWTCVWEAVPGRHTLSVRATDGEGRTQPLEQPWNRGGFGNNLVQRAPVLCC